MRVGFSGTRAGMTPEQLRAFRVILTVIEAVDSTGVNEFCHGDCVGADVEAATLARAHSWRIIAYPSNDVKTNANYPSDVRYAAAPPLDRNHIIVAGVELLIAAPRSQEEQLRSGTWATVRYAWKIGCDVVMVYPDGSVS